MGSKRKKYVTLQFDPEGNGFMTYNSLRKAVEALDDLGLCMNWAILTKTEKHPFTTLLYEGWTYKRTPERCVIVPFDKDCGKFEDRFSELLQQIFKPFIILGDDVHRSLISVVPGDDGHKDDCYFVTLVLHFYDEKGILAKAIQDSLSKVEDGHCDVSGRVFWLD